MGFRFRKRVRLGKGVYLNLSKSGVSASIGGKGLTYNTRGRVTAGIPGTGISYTSTIPSGGGRSAPTQASDATQASGCSPGVVLFLVALIAGLIFPPLFVGYLIFFAMWVGGKMLDSHKWNMYQKEKALEKAKEDRKKRMEAFLEEYSDIEAVEVVDVTLPPPPRLEPPPPPPPPPPEGFT